MGAGATAVTVADSIVKVSLIKFVGVYFSSIVIGAVRHTAPIKIRYVHFTFSQTEKTTESLKLT